MGIFITGDCHGNLISKFSYKNNPSLKQLTTKDTMIILGDIGIPWPDYEKDNLYQLDWLNDKPWRTIFIRGNHDWYDVWNNYRLTSYYGLTQVYYKNKLYKNLYAVKNIASFNIEGKKFLFIGGAESHDIDILLDPNQPNYASIKHRYDSNHTFYRVIGKSYWQQEKVNETSVSLLLDKGKKYYDYILSHDSPSIIANNFKRPEDTKLSEPTKSQELLEKIRKQKDFGVWFFGHWHNEEISMDLSPETLDNKLQCIYNSIIELN